MNTAAALSTSGETTFAVEQKKHLVKTLRRFDMVFFTVAVIVGLDLIGQAASNGFEALTWTVVLVVLFLIPYGLVWPRWARHSPPRVGHTSGSS